MIICCIKADSVTADWNIAPYKMCLLNAKKRLQNILDDCDITQFTDCRWSNLKYLFYEENTNRSLKRYVIQCKERENCQLFICRREFWREKFATDNKCKTHNWRLRWKSIRRTTSWNRWNKSARHGIDTADANKFFVFRDSLTNN